MIQLEMQFLNDANVMYILIHFPGNFLKLKNPVLLKFVENLYLLILI